MATMYPFDLIGNDVEDPSQLLIVTEQQQKVVAATKKEQVQGPSEDGEAGKSVERRPYAGPRGPYRGGFGSGEEGDEERPRRNFERRSGTGRGNEFKCEGSSRGNWGSPTHEISEVTEYLVDENEKSSGDVKHVGEEDSADLSKETPVNVPEEKEADFDIKFDWTVDKRIMVPVRHQQNTNSSWAIATCTVIEMLYNIYSETSLATIFKTCHDYVPNYVFLSHQHLIDSLSPLRLEDVDYKTQLMHHCTKVAHDFVAANGVWFLKDCPSVFRKKNENEINIEELDLSDKVVKVKIGRVCTVPEATREERRNEKKQYYKRLEDVIRKQPITITVPFMINTVQVGEDNIIRKPLLLSPAESKLWEFGHSVVAVGFGKSGETKFVKILNSFGKQWGVGGYGLVDMKLVEFGVYPEL